MTVNNGVLACLLNDEYCFVFSDSRVVAMNGQTAVFGDRIQKIFKLNDDVCFAAYGTFMPYEKFTAPFEGVDPSDLYADTAGQYIIDYMHAMYKYGYDKETLPTRIYILCGRDSDGTMKVHFHAYNEEKKSFDETVLSSDDNNTIAMWLPNKLNDRREEFQDLFCDYITRYEEDPIIDRVQKFLEVASTETQFVNNIVQAEYIY